MALGIYKQGQGYWVRVLTAAFIGVLILAGAGWGWGQAGAVRLPARSWAFSLIDTQIAVDQAPAVGDTVVLMGYQAKSDDLREIGRATIESFSAERGNASTLVIAKFDSDETRDLAGDAEQIFVYKADSSGDLTGDLPTMEADVRSATYTPIFPVQYLQTGVAGGLMLLGAIGLFIYVGSYKRSVEFLVATDGEMKKVNWTSYREVKGSTIVVIVATFLIAGILFLTDMAFSSFFSAIGVLER